MSVEENKAFIRRLYDELVNAGNTNFSDFFAPNFVSHTPNVADFMPGGTIQGAAAMQAMDQELAAIRTMMPDVHLSIEEMLGEGDEVGVRGRTQGTHTGSFPGIPATGRQITLTWMVIYRIADGRIIERWLNADDLNSFQQFGIIPPLQQSAS